jgi:DNA replication and repair protein RecF
MLAERISCRGFRNLGEFELGLPPSGALFLGPNAHGKTSILESLYYPVLYRSFRNAPDTEVSAWDGPGFSLTLDSVVCGQTHCTSVGFDREARRKRVVADGVEVGRITDAVGKWLAVVFLPTDLSLLQGGAAERRRFLDRMLSLSDPVYLRALLKYRAVIAQRNAALRAGEAEVVRVFTEAMVEPGSYVVGRRLRWVAEGAERYATESEGLGELGQVTLSYQGNPDLAEAGAWSASVAEVERREFRRGATLIGPQRDDLQIRLNGRSLREFGSTGQQRAAAVVLKVCELLTLEEAHGETPAFLLDDVFAELDRSRQERLTARLTGPGMGQVFLTAPRRDELPPAIDLEVFQVRDGRAHPTEVTV